MRERVVEMGTDALGEVIDTVSKREKRRWFIPVIYNTVNGGSNETHSSL